MKKNILNNDVNFHINRVIEALNKMQITKELNIDHNKLKQLLNLDDENHIFQQISSNADLNNQEKTDLLFYMFLDRKDLYFLSKAVSISTKYYFAAWVLQSLIHKIDDDYEYSYNVKAKLQKSNKWDSELVDELFNNIELCKDDIELFADLEIVQKKINELYKNNDFTSKPNINNFEELGWFNQNINIKYNDVIEIGDYNGGKLYGYIPEDYKLEQWYKVLNKGFVKRTQKKQSHTEGVKFIDKKVLELKKLHVDGDNRLYTTKVHKNDNNDFVAIFTKIANHKNIERVVKNTKTLKILDDCHSYQILDDITTNNNDFHSTEQVELCGESF